MTKLLIILYNIITHPLRMIKTLNELKQWAAQDSISPVSPPAADSSLWANRCRAIILTTMHHKDFPKTLQALYAFYKHPISCLRDFPSSVPDGEVILLAAVKNDCSRIEHLLEHYRKIGVRRFVFIDNGSDDETVSKILGQPDTACYQTRAEFNSAYKAGWLNRLAAHYGADRWYIVIDSDEHLVYPGMSKMPVSQYIEAARGKGCPCVKTVMLDVYPDGPLMDTTMSDEEYLGRCVYFDRADRSGHAGMYEYNPIMNAVSGGMRGRLFFEDNDVKLTRPTLLCFSHIFLLSPHVVFPKKTDRSVPHGGALLHYKFLPSDREKYHTRAREGNFYDGSIMYKTINSKLEQTPVINAMSEFSVRFNADDFDKYLPFVKNVLEER